MPETIFPSLSGGSDVKMEHPSQNACQEMGPWTAWETGT